MRVGVTGASGLIGSALAAALRARGDTVVTFVRDATRRDDAVRWDPSRGTVDEDDLRRSGPFDAVVHLAGAGIAERRWSVARRHEILESRTRSTSLLVAALTASGAPATVASGSAIGYYGSRGDSLLDESSTSGDDFLADVCRQWEDAAAPLRAAGTAVAHLRTGIVQSTRGGALRRQLPLFRLGLGGRLGSGRQWMSPISIDDEVRAITWVIDRRLDGPVNLVAPEPLTNRDFTRALARATHRRAVAHVPAFALSLALGRDLTEGVVLASQRVLPRRLSESGFVFEAPDATTILASVLARGR